MGEFDQALVLTTPEEQSKRVKDAQYLMQGNGPVATLFPGLACYKDGQVDGDYGLMSAQAAARTKHWLGYAAKNCTQTFGQDLYNLLVGHTHLTPAQKRLRSQRLAAKSPGADALDLLKLDIGLKEDPRYSNRQKFGAWYSEIMHSPFWNGVPWCAETESYCFWHTGYKRFIYAAVVNIFNDALAGRNNLRIVHSPEYGDLALYSIHGSKFAHTAFFDAWIDRAAGRFFDVGGNTGPSNISNGGEVLRQERSTSIVLAFVRVG